VSIEGQAPVAANQLPAAMQESISRGYFRTLRQGRAFDERDRADAPAVAMVRESMVRRLWPGNAAIGRRVKLGAPCEPRYAMPIATAQSNGSESMEEKVRRQASGLRYIAGLMAVFVLAALVLAAVGVYGVMAYSVNERPGDRDSDGARGKPGGRAAFDHRARRGAHGWRSGDWYPARLGTSAVGV